VYHNRLSHFLQKELELEIESLVLQMQQLSVEHTKEMQAKEQYMNELKMFTEKKDEEITVLQVR
jgi:hypothetical protein